jgi:hypothetical protein
MTIYARPTTGWTGCWQEKGDLASIAHAAALQPTAAMTLDFRVRPFANDLAARPVLICKGDLDDGYQVTLEEVSDTMRLTFQVRVGGVNHSVQDPNPVPRDVWTRYTCRYDGTNVTLAKSAVGIATAALTGALDTNTGPLRLGDAETPGDNSFAGLISEVSLWNIALLDAQITGSASTPWVGVESGLVAYWRFREGIGAQAADLTPSLRHLVVANPHQWSVLRGTPY